MGELYSKIASLCDNRGISVFKLCREIGMQPSVITELKKERTNSLSAKNLQKIATYFGVSVAYLLGETDRDGVDDTLERLSEKEKALLHSYRTMTEEQARMMEIFIHGLKGTNDAD